MAAVGKRDYCRGMRVLTGQCNRGVGNEYLCHSVFHIPVKCLEGSQGTPSQFFAPFLFPFVLYFSLPLFSFSPLSTPHPLPLDGYNLAFAALR